MAIAVRPHRLAAVACLPFLALAIIDGTWKPELARGPMMYFWAYDSFKWILVPLVSLAFLHRASSVAPRDYGLYAPLGWKDIAMVTPLPLFALALSFEISTGLAGFVLGHPTPPFTYLTLLRGLGPLWILGTLYLAVTAGLWESVFFIGLPWRFVSQTWKPSAGLKRRFALTSALVFAIAHFENGPVNMFGVFVFELFAVRWYFKLGTLLPIIGAHALIDAYEFWPWPWFRI